MCTNVVYINIYTGVFDLRRNEKEKGEAFALRVINECEYATLGTINKDGTPYCVVISPVLIGKTVYFHSAMEGQKNDNITNNPNICMSCVGYTKRLPEKYSMEYESAVLFGKCVVVTDDDEKIKGLRAITEKYAKDAMDQFEKRVAGALNITCVFKIEIETITGKGTSAS